MGDAVTQSEQDRDNGARLFPTFPLRRRKRSHQLKDAGTVRGVRAIRVAYVFCLTHSQASVLSEQGLLSWVRV